MIVCRDLCGSDHNVKSPLEIRKFSRNSAGILGRGATINSTLNP
jgi:hypothetical protein